MSQLSHSVLRICRFGWFVAITFGSIVAMGQPEVAPAAPPAETPAAAPAQPAPAGQGAAAAPVVRRPAAIRAEKKTAPIEKQAAQSEPVAAPAAAEPAALPQPASVHQPSTPEAAPAPAAAEAHGQTHGPADTAAEAHGQTHGPQHGPAESAAAAEHHAAHHESDQPPTLDDINWAYGFLGESDDGEPSILYRPKGMQPPFLATLLNWACFVAVIVLVAKKQLPDALAKRKASIVQGMQDAKKARDESAERLREYEDKLAKIDRDIERIKDEMRKAGELERDRILAEAVERRTRMERDARRLIETELEATKESLRRHVVQIALATAKKSVETEVEATDQQRLFDEAMASLKKLPARSLGGRT
jgi:F-type H+-transporting ATPase subunit b